MRTAPTERLCCCGNVYLFRLDASPQVPTSPQCQRRRKQDRASENSTPPPPLHLHFRPAAETVRLLNNQCMKTHTLRYQPPTVLPIKRFARVRLAAEVKKVVESSRKVATWHSWYLGTLVDTWFALGSQDRTPSTPTATLRTSSSVCHIQVEPRLSTM